MTTYATIQDLEAGWRTLTEDEARRAETLLERASLFLDGKIEQYRIDPIAKAAALRTVCCDLVQRKLETPTSAPIQSETRTAGAFSETVSYSSHRKSWELYPEDLELLGAHSKRARSRKIVIHDKAGEAIDW